MFGKLPGIGGETSIKIENLNVNGEDVAEGDPKNELFHVGDTAKGENAGFIYMDETVAAEQECKDVELDVVLTYENKSGSALIKKQVQRFHLKKKCDVASTVQNVKVVLYDWCAHNWGIPAAEWDQAQVYETSFVTSHLRGGMCEPTATGELNLGEILSGAQATYPELAAMTCQWNEPTRNDMADAVQYSVHACQQFLFPDTVYGCSTIRCDNRDI